ncbi:MAG TPA: hypothetical protein DEB40_14840 [Elusimicrobia bacterium]|nr:hypothetical protein [Elusimicrobiota bacterium]HBT63012.1 hypothetical protein [Elusimicrobiota bacterium]
MGLRAYLLIRIADDVSREQAEKALRQVEGMPEVDFADPVVGSYDLVVMVETAQNAGAVAEQICRLAWVKSLEILKITTSFERHRAPAA